MTETVAALVFWTSAVLIVYGYAGYPLLIHLLGRRHVRASESPVFQPTVSVLVPAYNEEQAITAKIENCLQLQYPRDRLEILVASDGSTDATAMLIEAASNAGLIRGFIYPTRRGKTAVLNDVVRAASGEILVFTDATTLLDPGSLDALASRFGDPRVGCVSGVYRVTSGVRGQLPRQRAERLGGGSGLTGIGHRSAEDSNVGQESLYWRYETFIRLAESRLGTMLGAHGSLYGIRRELFEPLDPRIINDDFVIPMMILLEGLRSVYETGAIAREDGREMAGFSRRIRIMTGNYQQLVVLLRRGGWTKRPWLLFQLLSHKGLRLLIPFLIISAYVSNGFMLSSPWYRATFAAQTAFFIAALLGESPRLRRLGGALLAGPHYLCMLNLAALVGLHRTVWQRSNVVWKSERD